MKVVLRKVVAKLATTETEAGLNQLIIITKKERRHTVMAAV